MNLKQCLGYLNFPRQLCHHAFDPRYSHRHRMLAGIILMFLGVGIAKSHVFIHGAEFLLDLIGYAVHGIGAAPFIERLLGHANEHE